MERIEIIKTIIELHNFFVVEWGKSTGRDNSDNLWNLELVDVKPDRHYLVESLYEEKDCDYENKTFIPSTEVRYHLRSKERAKYGNQHDAFFKGYLSTITVENRYLNNPQEYKDLIIKELTKK